MLRIVYIIGAFILLAVGVPARAERDLTGTTASGAYYRIAVPDSWHNGDTLILFQHGLSFSPPGPNPDLGPLADLQLAEGYAIAASSFSQRSWALFNAADDNAQLLDAFRQQVGMPGAIIPYGGSLGGLIALKLAEDSRFAPVPGVYSACPPAAGSRVWDAGIDLRLSYDVVCQGAGDLPTGDAPYPWAYNLDDIPDNLSDLEDEALLLETLVPLNQCTGVNLPSYLRNDAMQRRLDQLMSLAHITSEHFFVVNAGYATYALSDLVRAPDKLDGLSPFSSVGVDYGDATINANIARIQPDPFAALYFRWSSDFRGRIGAAKVISLHTSQDQLVIPANQAVLRATLPSGQLLSALVNEDSPTHCGFTLAEGVAGWEALRAWIAGAAQPGVNDLQSGCQSAVASGAGGPCRFDASIVVPSFDSQVRPRPASTAAPIDARYNGQWYDPTRSGEGIELEILDGGKALVYMFTYPPVGAPGLQAWLYGVGDILDNGIEVADVLHPTLDPATATPSYEHWGRFSLVFDDCMHGGMRWDGPADWGAREVNLVHLTALTGLDCGAGTDAPAQASGTWYDPRYTGSGFLFDQIDAQQLTLLYFGYDSAGNPAWLAGIAALGSDGSYSADLAQPIGPRFGAAFDPGALEYFANGTLAPLQLACATGSAQLDAVAGFSDISATLALQRLTQPLGLPACP